MNESDWRQILKNHPESNFLQSPEWAAINERVGHKVIVKDFGDNNFALMIVKDAKRGRYLEIPGGPLVNWDDEARVKEVFAEIRKIAAENKCVFVRFRPMLETSDEALKKVAVAGAKPAPFHLHAEHTVILDIANKTPDEILAEMRRQTRYEVRRALKLGMKVESGNSPELFKKFHEIQAETAARQHFIPPSMKDLDAYREVFGDNVRIYVVSTGDQPDPKNEDVPVNTPVAYGLIILNENEADYFEAASTEYNYKVPGAYALQWQVIQDLKELGIPRYNLWGIAPAGQPNHRYAGVTTFKTGFGGRKVEYVHAHDLVINRSRYGLDYMVETIRKKVRHLS